MDWEKLKRDWADSPQLNFYAFDTVEELAQHLAKCHKMMMNGELGCLGYLYRQQTLRVRQLTEELENGRKNNSKGF